VTAGRSVTPEAVEVARAMVPDKDPATARAYERVSHLQRLDQRAPRSVLENRGALLHDLGRALDAGRAYDDGAGVTWR